ncbi:L,D-transpeptidase family protein [Pararoseomonas sp. SCSIO 73927]|uniref:L,D-transpeptidase family protein n=1 Tax=Pararoseomonas sp. SCSIO 73927 TaxID=3114537 RepID=UPI0030CBEFDB
MALPFLARAAAGLERLVVPDRGQLVAGDLALRCAIGAAGARAEKREGDKASPAGVFPLREVLYRPDRVAPVQTALPCRALRPSDGWCDDAGRPEYNRPVTLPFDGSHEELWREDGLYDVIAVIGYNDSPPVPGLGSAIFLHVAAPDWGPTLGCVSIERPALVDLLARCGPGTTIEIAPS